MGDIMQGRKQSAAITTLTRSCLMRRTGSCHTTSITRAADSAAVVDSWSTVDETAGEVEEVVVAVKEVDALVMMDMEMEGSIASAAAAEGREQLRRKWRMRWR